MNEKDYQRMRAEIDAERDQKIAAINEEHRLAIERIEWVWQRFNGGLFRGQQQQQQQSSQQRPAPSPIAPARSSVARPSGPVNFILAIKRAIAAMERVTRDDVVRYLDAHYPEMNAAARKETVTSSLSRLNRNGELVTIQKGTRDTQQVYQKTATFSLETGIPRSEKPAEANA